MFKQGVDDTNGYYHPVQGETLGGRYSYQDFIGHGTYSCVVEALDTVSNRQVAIKILRSQKIFADVAREEIAVFERLRGMSGITGSTSVVKLLGKFVHRNHVCLVFPRHGNSILDLLRLNGSGFNFAWAKELSKSFLIGMFFLHRCGLAHCDIKTENILCYEKPVASKVRDHIFIHPPTPDVVICDLGSANKGPEATTRQYRPPEALLGLNYSGATDSNSELALMCSSDVWSCGCVLYEIFFGKLLFPTLSTATHLAMISKLVGSVDDDTHMHLISIGASATFTSASQTPHNSSQSDKLAPCAHKSVQHVLRYLSNYNIDTRQFDIAPNACETDVKSYKELASLSSSPIMDLLKQMLRWNPLQRPTIKTVLRHPLFQTATSTTRATQTDGEYCAELERQILALRALLDEHGIAHPGI